MKIFTSTIQKNNGNISRIPQKPFKRMNYAWLGERVKKDKNKKALQVLKWRIIRILNILKQMGSSNSYSTARFPPRFVWLKITK